MSDPAPDRPIVHVIDDDEAARESLGFLLSTAGHAVRLYPAAADFLAVAAAARSGCIITDMRMPGMTGLDLINAIRAQGITPLPIIVVTGHGDVPLAVAAMKAGAGEFLEKPYSEAALLAAVANALAADADLSEREARRAQAAQRIARLSGRERDVLRGLVRGESNKVIAAALGISPRTVEIYRANLMAKTDAGSLSELVRLAMLAGVADL